MDLCALPDGRIVTIRPIRRDDAERLRRSHDRLSPESQYRRFMTSKPHLSTADAHYLVDIDGRDHYALVATVADPVDEAIVAVARFVRIPTEPRIAEFAIVVGDAWQRQGLGAELLGRLADAAVTRGIERFRASMLADNVGIRRLMARVAAGPLVQRRVEGVCEVDFDLPTRGGAPLPAGTAGEAASPSPSDGAPAMIAAWAGS